ncbi:hypothetical protein SLA2020_520220 [Shorea laevis]
MAGVSLYTIKRTVRYLCPADIIPPYIEVDPSELDVGQKLVMGDLKVHPAPKLCRSKDEPVCKIMGGRVSDQQKKSKDSSADISVSLLFILNDNFKPIKIKIRTYIWILVSVPIP